MFSNIYYDSFKNKIYLWEIVNGKVKQTVHDHEVEYYVDDPEMKSPIRDIYGNSVIKKQASSRNALTELRRSKLKMYESDLSEEVKFLHKHYGDTNFKPNTSDYKVANIDIEIQSGGEFPKPEEAKYPVNLITIDFYKTDTIYTLGLEPYNGQFKDRDKFTYIHYKTEEELLVRFCDIIRKERTQIITGWNIDGFDIPYICNRMINLGIDDEASMSPIGRHIKKRNGKFSIPGISCLDLMELYKKFSYQNQSSYSLNYIGIQEVGEGKLDFEGQINDLWARDWELFVDYNIQDCFLVRKIESKRKFIDLVINLCTETRTPFERVFSTISIVEGYMLRYMHRENMVFPDNNVEYNDDDEDETIEGGYVEAHPGFYLKSLSIDAESLYPSIIRMFNISPETKISDISNNDIKTITPNIGYKKDKQGILPRVVTDIFNDRKKFKNMMFDSRKDGDESLAEYYDSQQLIRKILINCFHKDTDIITTTGIKKVKDVKIGEYVLSINPLTKEVEEKRVVDTIAKHYTGKLVNFEHDRVKLRTTPDHDMLKLNHKGVINKVKANKLVGYSRWNAPKHLPMNEEFPEYIYLSEYVDVNDYYFILNKDIDTRHCKKEMNELFGLDFITITDISYNDRKRYKFITNKLTPEQIDLIESIGYSVLIRHVRDYKCSMIKSKISNKDFSSYVGWYLSEGSLKESIEKDFSTTKRGISKGITISQNIDVNLEYYNEIDNLHSRIFTKYNKGNKGFTVSNDAIYHIMKSNFGDKFDKRIYKTELGKKIISKTLFDSMYKGDGNKRNFRYTITKKNECLMNDFMVLMVKLGEIPRLNSKDYSENACYRITHRNGTSFIKDDVTEEEYDDMVYCLNVEDNHTVLVGENGTFMWSGQCMYGVLCNKFFHFYDLDNAATITGHGRDAIQYISKCINEYFHSYFYKIAKEYYPNSKLKYGDITHRSCFVNDTDSAYITFNTLYEKTNSGESFLDWSLKFEKDIFQPFLKQCMDIYSDKFNAPNMINFKREKIILKQYVQGKKKYATLIIANEKDIYEKPVLKVTGIEINRSDLCAYSRKKVKKLVDIMMDGDEYAMPNKEAMVAYIRQCYKEFKSQKIEDISTPKGVKGYRKYHVKLNSTFDNFLPATPIHNRASIIYNYIIKDKKLPYMEVNDGAKIKFVFINPKNKYRTNVVGYIGNFPKEFAKEFTIDYDEQFNKQFKGIAQRMFEVLNFGDVTLKDSKLLSMIEEE